MDINEWNAKTEYPSTKLAPIQLSSMEVISKIPDASCSNEPGCTIPFAKDDHLFFDWSRQQSLIDLEHESKVKNAIARKNIYDLESFVPRVCSLNMIIHVRDRSGSEQIDNPLTACVKTGWADGVRYLLRCYAMRGRLDELDKKDESGLSLIHCAIANSEIMSMLLDSGLNPLLRDNSGNTPVMMIKALIRLNVLDEKRKAEAEKNIKLIEAAARRRLEKVINTKNNN